MTLNRDWIRRVVDSRWFALADFAIVFICVIFLTIQELDTAQEVDLGHWDIGGWPIVFALMPWGIRLVAGRFPFQRTKLDFPIAIFLLTAAIGVWAAYDRDVAWAKFWLIAGGILIYYGVAGQPRVNHWVLAGLFGFLGLALGGYFFLTNDWLIEPAKIELINEMGAWWMSVRPSLHAPGFDSNVVAGLMAMMTPFLVAFGIHAWHVKRKFLTLLAMVVSGLMLMAVFLTTSRGAWMALGAGLGIWLLWGLSGYSIRFIRWPRSRIFAIALLSLISLFVWLVIVYPGGIEGLTDYLPGPSSAGRRLELAGETFDLITDFPFTGGGLRSFSGLYSRYITLSPIIILEHSHNLYLDVLLEQGPLGFLALIALLIGSCVIIMSSLRKLEFSGAHENILHWAAFSSLAVLSIHGLVDYSHEGAPVLFLLAGMSSAVTKPGRLQHQGGKQEVGQGLLTAQGVSKQLWKIAVVVIPLIATVTVLYSFRKPILASLYANLGALEMARVEVADRASVENFDGELVFSMGKAEALFLEALRLDPDNQTAHHRLGLIDLQRQDFTTAVNHLERAYQQDEGHRGIWRSLGSSYVWAGQFDQGNDLVKELSSYGSGTENDVLEAWLATERDPHDWLWLVYEAIKAGNEGFAITLMEQQSLGGKYVAIRVVDAASEASDYFLWDVQAWVGAGDYKSLEIAAEQATKDGLLDNAMLVYHALQVITGERHIGSLALFLWEKKDDLASAEIVLRQALEVYPNSQSRHAWFRYLGDLMRVQNRWEEAQTAYQQALQIDPDNLSVLTGLGWAYYEQKDGVEAAMEAFQQAVALHPESMYGYFAMGKVLERERRFLEAALWFEKALERDSECRWCYMHIGDNALRVGDLPLALEFYTEAITLFPNFAYAHSQISWAYHLDDQPQKAIASIEQAMALVNTPEPWMLLSAAEIYERSGDFEEAVSLYISVLEIDSENEVANEGLSRLDGSSE